MAVASTRVSCQSVMDWYRHPSPFCLHPNTPKPLPQSLNPWSSIPSCSSSPTVIPCLMGMFERRHVEEWERGENNLHFDCGRHQGPLFSLCPHLPISYLFSMFAITLRSLHHNIWHADSYSLQEVPLCLFPCPLWTEGLIHFEPFVWKIQFRELGCNIFINVQKQLWWDTAFPVHLRVCSHTWMDHHVLSCIQRKPSSEWSPPPKKRKLPFILFFCIVTLQSHYLNFFPSSLPPESCSKTPSLQNQVHKL